MSFQITHAMSKAKLVQWYQSSEYVTASLKLRTLSPSETRRDIEGKFGERYCAIYEGGKLYWECYLADKIVPQDCKVCKPGRVRVEIKLKKAEPDSWTDYEVDSRSTSGNHVNHSGQHRATPSPTAAMATPTSAVPTASNRIAPQELTYINHLPHDFYDMGGDTVKLKIQLAHLNKQKCRVIFQDRSLELQFQTSDERFLNTHQGSTSSTTFVWSVQLSGAIDIGSSRYDFQPNSLEVTLKKRSSGRWKTLEDSRRGPGIVSAPSTRDDLSQLDETLNDLNTQVQSLELHPDNSRTVTISNDITTTSQQKNVKSQKVGDLPSNENPEEDKRYNWQYPYDERSPDPPGPQSSNNPTSPSSGDNQFGGESPSSEEQPEYYYCPYHGTYHVRQSKKYGPSTSKLHPDCKLAVDLETSNPNYRIVQLSRPSLTGLCNLGNSCFMNSVLQCLSNTQLVRDYFVNGRHLADINRDNPLGFKGELAKAFSFLIRKLWSGEYEYFAPKKLRSVIASKSSNFGDNEQHDSHEFMSYLLDGLHEDLNRIRNKPQTSPVESDGQPDTEVAKEAWRVYKMRNDSYFVDLFQGLFKSTLVCAVCSKESVTFDPFMSMSVPIPGKLRSLPVYFVPCDPKHLPTKYVLRLAPEGNLELLKGAVARRSGISMPQLRVFEAYKGKFQTMLSNNRQPIKDIDSNDVIIVSEVLSERVAKEKVVEFHVIQRVQVPFFPTKCATCDRLADDVLKKEGRKIQRCSKCKAVGYCSSDCQRRDWSYHRSKCRGGRPTPVGLPFVVSLPISQLTYSRLASVAEKFARFSVEVTRNGSSSARNDPPQVGGANSAATGGGSNEGAGKVNKERPMYYFTPVDRYGDNRDMTEPLEDLGDQLLTINTHFLAMDWRNNTREDGSVTITPKETMDFHLDPESAAGASHSSDVSNDLTLEECLERFTEPESLSEGDSWYCPQCKKHCEATKQMSVWTLPQILIIHLKRFSFHNGYYRNKIKKLVKFPMNGLDMSPYLLGDAAKLISPKSPPIYDLYAIVHHYGNSYIGHYVNTAKAPSSEGLGENYRWLRYDDDKVYKVKDSGVVDNDAYILFYHRRTQAVYSN